jgi:hypothetical protein
MSSSGVLGRDVMSLVFLELDILDASRFAIMTKLFVCFFFFQIRKRLGEASRSLHQSFCSEQHFRRRLKFDFGRSVEFRAPRHGKGAKKKNPRHAVKSIDVYIPLHLTRRAAFRYISRHFRFVLNHQTRTLVSFSRIRGSCYAHIIHASVRRVESDSCRSFDFSEPDKRKTRWFVS